MKGINGRRGRSERNGWGMLGDVKYITYTSVLHTCVKMPYETQSYV